MERAKKSKSTSADATDEAKNEEPENMLALEPRRCQCNYNNVSALLVAEEFSEEEEKTSEQMEFIAAHVEDAKAQRDLCNQHMKQKMHRTNFKMTNAPSALCSTVRRTVTPLTLVANS